MLVVVRCKNCAKTDCLSIQFSFTSRFEFCRECGHSKCSKWDFHFCDLKCLFEWMEKNKVEKKGFPCQDCMDRARGEPTGFAHGFKANGVCWTCGGKKRVKAAKNLILKSRSI